MRACFLISFWLLAFPACGHSARTVDTCRDYALSEDSAAWWVNQSDADADFPTESDCLAVCIKASAIESCSAEKAGADVTVTCCGSEEWW